MINESHDQKKTRKAFAELLSNPSDRAVGIVAGALLENALENTLVFKLKKIGAGNTDEVFRGDAPFNTFASKIKLAFTLNLIGWPARRDLDCVREIRNAFAHTKRPHITFDTPEIKEVCTRIDDPLLACDAPRINEPGYLREAFLLATLIQCLYLFELATPGNHPGARRRLNRKEQLNGLTTA